MTENERDLINRKNIDYYRALNTVDRDYILHTMNILSSSTIKDTDLRALQDDLVSMASEAESSGATLEEMLGTSPQQFCGDIMDTFHAGRKNRLQDFLYFLCTALFFGLLLHGVINRMHIDISYIIFCLFLFSGLAYLNAYLKTRLTLRKKDPQVWQFGMYVVIGLAAGTLQSLCRGFGVRAGTLSVPVSSALLIGLGCIFLYFTLHLCKKARHDNHFHA